MSNPRLTITELTITSSATDHRAERDTVAPGWWRVTWLGDRRLTQNQAITAMTIAELIACGARPGQPVWVLVADFAAELDLTAEAALHMINEQHTARLEGTMIDAITLDVHICDQRRSYLVIFEGPRAEEMALAFIASRDNNHVFSERLDAPNPLLWALHPRLADHLYPTCPHGLSADLCEGPQHYGYDDDERRAYGL